MKAFTKYNLKVFQTAEALHQAADKFIIEQAAKAIAERGRFIISLSGGNTPQKLYALLAQPEYSEQIDWKSTFIFWGDERCVPLDDERNNVHHAVNILLNKVSSPKNNIHRIQVNLPPADAATKYEKE